MPGLHLTRQALSGLGDIPLTTVVGRDLQGETPAAGSQLLGFAHGRLQLGMKTRTITDDAQADVVIQQPLGLATQRTEEQLHQRTDLSAGRCQFSLEKANRVSTSTPDSAQHLDYRANRIDPGLVPGYTRQQALLRPAVVAIHDDGDMPRHRPLLVLVHVWASQPSNSHQVRFFHLERLVDISDELVGDLLQLVSGATLFVFADFLGLGQLLQLGQGITTHIAHSDLGIFGHATRLLGVALPGFLRSAPGVGTRMVVPALLDSGPGGEIRIGLLDGGARFLSP